MTYYINEYFRIMMMLLYICITTEYPNVQISLCILNFQSIQLLHMPIYNTQFIIILIL